MAPNDQTYPWLLDTDAGVITFYGTAEVPADATLTMTFWRYEGRIGVGEQSTVTQLTLGTANVENNLIVAGSIAAGKSTAPTATLDVAGAVAVSGNANLGSNTLRVEGANVGVGKGTGIISKTLDVGGTLEVAGTTTLLGVAAVGRGTAGNNTLDVSGTVGVASRLAVGKTSAPTNTLEVVGNEFVSGRLTVGSQTIGANVLDVAGNAAITGQVYVGKNTGIYAVDVSGTVGVTGATALLGSVSVGKTSAAVALDVSGAGRFSGAMGISGDLIVAGTVFDVDVATRTVGIGKISTGAATLDVSGSAAVSQSLTVSGNISGGRILAGKTVAGTTILDVSGAGLISGGLTIGRTVAGTAALDVSGGVYISRNLDVSGAANITGVLDVDGNGNILGRTTIERTDASGVAMHVMSNSLGGSLIGATNQNGGSDGNGQLYVGPRSAQLNRVAIGYDAGANVGVVNALTAGATAGAANTHRLLALNPFGGGVAVGKTAVTAGYALDVSGGGIYTSGPAFIAGTTSLNDNVTIATGKTLTVNGTSTLNDNVTVAATKNLIVGGRIGAGSTAAPSVELDVNGAARISGLATLTGGLTTPGSVTTTGSGGLTVAGAASLSSTLGVTGLTTLTGGVSVPGTSRLTGNVGVGKASGSVALDVSGAASVSGLATLTGGLTTPGNVTTTGSGRLAIGTANPLAMIDIVGGSDSNGEAGTPLIALQHYLVGGYRHFIKSRHNVGAVNTNAIDFYLNSGSDGGASTSPGVGNVHGMSITAAGVGIGTTTPAAKLEIYGGALHINTQSAAESRLSQDACGNYIYASARSNYVRLGGWGSGAKPLVLQPGGGGVCINDERLPQAGLALDVVGATKVNGTFNATGNTTVGGTLGVTGATTISNTLGITGNTSVGGTLGVTGATTINNTLGVTGNTTVGGTLGVTGATTINNTLGVTGNTTVGGTLGVTGLTTLSGELRVGSSDNANLIRFRGTPGEDPGAYTNTVIGEYRYDTTGAAERSELLLYKGNDATGLYGPDRVRVLANGGFQVDISTGAPWAVGGNPPAGTTALIVNSSGNVGIGNGAPTAGYKLDVTGATNITGNLNVTGTITGAISSSLGVQYI
jgi:hypothetical protein